MTAIVGVLCRDGVVIGADSSATFGAGGGIRTIEQPTEKITIVEGRYVVAGTGQVGLGQRFTRIVEVAHQGNLFRGHHIDVGRQLAANAIKDFASTEAKQGTFAALVAFPINHAPYLCEFAIADFQPEFKDDRMWYCSLGSGQLITDPFLAFIREVFWAAGVPSVQDGIFAVTWALDHAIAVNPGGVNGPVRIAILERSGGRAAARMLADDELQEHRENIQQAKERLRTFPAAQAPAATAPDIPRPAGNT